MSYSTPHLSQLLKKTRRRLRIELGVRVSSLALACAIPLMGSTDYAVRHLQLPELAWGGLEAVIGLAVMGFAAIYLFTRWPNYAEAARRADLHLETAELFSSAWGARKQTGAIAQALRERAEQSAVVLQTKSWPPTFLPPLAILAASLAATFAAGQLANIITPAQSVPVIATVPGVSLALREDLVAVAELLEKRAAQQDDAFVSSLAKSLHDLAQTTRTEPGDAEQLASQLAELRDYAAEAMKAWDRSVVEPLADVLDELVEISEHAAGTAAGQNLGARNATERSETAYENRSLREKIESLNEAESAAHTVAQGEALADEEAAYDYDQSPVAALAAQSEDEASSSSTSGAPAAPSDDATGGASAMAGDGTGDLDGSGDETALLTFEQAPELTLETIDSGEGQRVEEFILPETQDAIRVDAADLSLGDHWVHQEEAEVNRRAIGAIDQSVASRYRLLLRDGVTP